MKNWYRLMLFLLIFGVSFWGLGILKVAADQFSREQVGNGFSYMPGARFQRLTVEDGLPNATVLSVLQDKQGFIWFATADGLSRYDGYKFITYRHDVENSNSLSNNNTFSLLETRDGLLWIGTDPGGLNVFDPETGIFTLYSNDPKNSNTIPDNSVWSLLEDRDGSVWIGTRGGLSHFDRKKLTFTNYLHDSENPRSLADPVVYRIYQDRSGTIWVATRNGLQRFEPASNDFTTFKKIPDDPHSLSHNNVWAMLEDRQGNFWVGTRGGGLNLFDRETGTFKSYQHAANNPASISDDRIWNIYEDLAGRIWITTENGGLNLFDPQIGKFTSFRHNPNDAFSLSHNDVFWMCEDRSGVLWITSRYGGVNALYPGLQRFGWYRHIPEDPNTIKIDNVYSILAEKNDIVWIGTFGGGLSRYDRKTGRMQTYQNDPYNPTGISSNNIYSIYRDDKGVLWVATSGGGLDRLDENSGEFTAYKRVDNDPPGAFRTNFMTSIQPAGKNRLWIGTLGYGLDLFNTRTGKVEKEYAHKSTDPNSLNEDTVYDLKVDSLGRVWIATARGGMDLFEPETGQFTHYVNNPADKNSILSDTVQALFVDENNHALWAGTAGGLSRFDLNTQKWTGYTTKDGLSSDTIVGIQPGEDGSLWVSTSKGISRFNPLTGISENFDVRDGLQGNQFNIASTALGPDGEIFFGGPNGLNFFHVKDILKNTYEPKIVFTGLELFNIPVPVGSELLGKPIEYTQTLTFQPGQSVFTLEFAALSYQIPSKNLYRYKMDGFDLDWSPPKANRQATYTNLAPGTYTFLVHAANNDNDWSRTPAQLKIVILPPWWETWWFRLLVTLGVLGLIIGGVQLRIRQVHAQNRELEKRVFERTSELRAEIQLRMKAEDQLIETNEALQMKLEEITSLQQKLREQAIHDALTGLFNRHYLADVMNNELSRAHRNNYPVTFMLIDLDHFKDVNDTHGHHAGDAVLQAAAHMLNDHTRQEDYVFRYGGEEFLLILPGTVPKIALQRAEQLCADLKSMKVQVDGQAIGITASIGVAIYPVDGDQSEEILRYVDAALYQAKDKGRNRVMVAPNTERLASQ